jgi:hypothetical protein
MQYTFVSRHLEQNFRYMVCRYLAVIPFALRLKSLLCKYAFCIYQCLNHVFANLGIWCNLMVLFPV